MIDFTASILSDKIMTKVAKEMFRRYPKADQVLPPRSKKAGEEEGEEDEGSEADEAAILSDLEALLGPEEEEEEEEEKP